MLNRNTFLSTVCITPKKAKFVRYGSNENGEVVLIQHEYSLTDKRAKLILLAITASILINAPCFISDVLVFAGSESRVG